MTIPGHAHILSAGGAKRSGEAEGWSPEATHHSSRTKAALIQESRVLSTAHAFQLVAKAPSRKVNTRIWLHHWACPWWHC